MSSDLQNDLAKLRIEREPDQPSRRWIGWALLILALVAVAAAAYWWITREQPVEVQAETVAVRQSGQEAAVLNASGYVTARREATVSSKITGKVIEVNVEEGRAVHEGDVLARLDDSSAKAALALSQAQLDAARRALTENQVRRDQSKLTLQRDQALLKDGIVTQADVDNAKADVDSYEARIAAANQQVTVASRAVDVAQTDLDNTIIRAPFSGIAVTKDAQPGEMVSPVSAGGGFTRTGICTVVDMKSLEIDVDVNENYINRVVPGQRVSAVLNAYPDWQIPAHVITVVPTADRQKATVMVRIAFGDNAEMATPSGARAAAAPGGAGARASAGAFAGPKPPGYELDPRILPDMGVKVTFLRDEPESTQTAPAQPTILVSKDDVKTDGAQSIVYVVAGDHAERRPIKLGGTDGDRLEVLGGLHDGDRVILSPPAGLKDGTKILVK